MSHIILTTSGSVTFVYNPPPPSRPTNEMPPKDAPRNIVAGEIVAWRAWWVHNGRLRSTGMDRVVWEPGVPMTLNDHNSYGYPLDRGAGVHAFKTRAEVISRFPPSRGYVIGQVELWGEIVEHDNGYRAEYGAIKSLERGPNVHALRHMQRVYLPGQPVTSNATHRRAVLADAFRRLKPQSKADAVFLFFIGFAFANMAFALYNLAKLLFK